ncbi:MAG: hypothetical protein MJ239_00370 [Bacilli bacterium]|nr:hypothetical protein [Bacilli bacterium]
MEKKTLRILSVSALLAVTGTLAACGNNNPTSGSSDKSSASETSADKNIASITVDEWSNVFEQHFDMGRVGVEAEIFEDMVVTFRNAAGDAVEVIDAVDELTSFTHSEINTEVIGEYEFTLTYNGTRGNFQTQVAYVVDFDVMSSWQINGEYQKYISAKASVSEEKKIAGENPYPFMKAANFYVGNENAMSLLPLALPDSDELVVSYIDTLDPTIVNVKLFERGSTDELTLSDYFEEEDITALVTKGSVNFKDTVVGDFDLLYRYGQGTTPGFPDIKYEISVINGYNINTAKDLQVLNNDDRDGTCGERAALQEDHQGGANDHIIHDWKVANNIPTDKNRTVGIVQKDLVIGKDDVPSWYIYDKDVDQCNILIDGTWKDFAHVVKHTFFMDDPESEQSVNVYGNYHKISTGDDFPFITVVRDDPAPTGNMVEGHSALFGSNLQDFDGPQTREMTALRNNRSFNVYNLQAIGNQGVSVDSEGLETGLIFAKSFNDFNIENSVVTKFYDGTVQCNSDNIYGIQSALTLKDSRVNNTFMCGLFNWNSPITNIYNSEIMNAGGPLFFNQSNSDFTYTEFGITSSDWSGHDFLPNTAQLNIDEATYTENWVSGQGGWFKQYNCEAQISQIKQLNMAYYAATMAQSSFLDNGLKDYTKYGEGKMNFIMINMLNGSGIEAKEAGNLTKASIGGKTIVDTDQGRLETLGKLSGGDFSGLWTTNFGALASYSQMLTQVPMGFVISSGSVEDGQHYGYFDGSAMIDLMNMYAPSGTPSLDSSFQSNKFLTMYTLGSNNGIDLMGAGQFNNYKGSNAYGIVLGAIHPEA